MPLRWPWPFRKRQPEVEASPTPAAEAEDRRADANLQPPMDASVFPAEEIPMPVGQNDAPWDFSLAMDVLKRLGPRAEPPLLGNLAGLPRMAAIQNLDPLSMLQGPERELGLASLEWFGPLSESEQFLSDLPNLDTLLDLGEGRSEELPALEGLTDVLPPLDQHLGFRLGRRASGVSWSPSAGEKSERTEPPPTLKAASPTRTPAAGSPSAPVAVQRTAQGRPGAAHEPAAGKPAAPSISSTPSPGITRGEPAQQRSEPDKPARKPASGMAMRREGLEAGPASELPASVRSTVEPNVPGQEYSPGPLPTYPEHKATPPAEQERAGAPIPASDVPPAGLPGVSSREAGFESLPSFGEQWVSVPVDEGEITPFPPAPEPPTFIQRMPDMPLSVEPWIEPPLIRLQDLGSEADVTHTPGHEPSPERRAEPDTQQVARTQPSSEHPAKSAVQRLAEHPRPEGPGPAREVSAQHGVPPAPRGAAAQTVERLTSPAFIPSRRETPSRLTPPRRSMLSIQLWNVQQMLQNQPAVEPEAPVAAGSGGGEAELALPGMEPGTAADTAAGLSGGGFLSAQGAPARGEPAVHVQRFGVGLPNLRETAQRALPEMPLPNLRQTAQQTLQEGAQSLGEQALGQITSAAPAAVEAAQSQGMPNIQRLTDEIWREIQRRMRVERERTRGLS
jgi:hypothetical protein